MALAAATSATAPFLLPTPLRRISARHHANYVAFPLNYSANSKTVTTALTPPPTRTSHVIASAVSGPTSKQTAFDEKTADLLDEVQVFSLDGTAVPISNLWKDRKAAFAHHFGCVQCRKRADYLASEKARTFVGKTKFKGARWNIVAERNFSYIHKEMIRIFRKSFKHAALDWQDQMVYASRRVHGKLASINY